MAQSSIFTDIPHLTDEFVDASNAKLEMETLRDLCLAYNNNHTTDLIELNEIENDRVAMILALWMRDVIIPETITWGSPYDEGLKESLLAYIKLHRETFFLYGEEGENYRLPRVKENIFYKVFTKPQQLLGYICASIQARYCEMDNTEVNTHGAYLEKLNHLLNRLGKPPLPNRFRICCSLELLKTIDLIYIILVGSFLKEYQEIFGSMDFDGRKTNAFGYSGIYYPVC